MEKSPYTFADSNPRLVANLEQPSSVYPAAGLIFAASLFWYNKRYFRKDQNFMNMLGFGVASVPASYVYANYFLNDEVKEAGLINNERERNWLRKRKPFNRRHPVNSQACWNETNKRVPNSHITDSLLSPAN